MDSFTGTVHAGTPEETAVAWLKIDNARSMATRPLPGQGSPPLYGISIDVRFMVKGVAV